MLFYRKEINMPPKSKTSKEDILNASFLIARRKGITEVNARSIAKQLNCSTQPLFRIYQNMNELKEDLIEKIYQYYREFTERYSDDDELFRVSYAYIEFARKEKNLFKAVYVSDVGGTRSLSQVITSTYNQNIIQKMVKQYQITEAKANQVFRDVRFYSHGIASYILVDSISLSDQEVVELLKIAIDKFKNE